MHGMINHYPFTRTLNVLVLVQEVRGPIPPEAAYAREVALRPRYQRGQQRNPQPQPQPQPPYDNRQPPGLGSWPQAPALGASWAGLGAGTGGAEAGVGVGVGMFAGTGNPPGGGGERHAHTNRQQQQQLQQARWEVGGVASGARVASSSRGGGGGGGGAPSRHAQQQQQQLLLQQQRPSWVADATTGAVGPGANGVDFGRPISGSNSSSKRMPVGGGGMRDTAGDALGLSASVGVSGGGDGGGDFGGRFLGGGGDMAYQQQQQQQQGSDAWVQQRQAALPLVAHRRTQQQEQQQAQVPSATLTVFARVDTRWVFAPEARLSASAY